MGQTLSHGVYLPNEGERNCYAGLASNWQILNTAVGAIAEKAPLVHTHTVSQITDFPAYGTTAGTICEGNDSRLSDARTPVAHTHSKSDVTDLFNSANVWTGLNTFSNAANCVFSFKFGSSGSYNDIRYYDSNDSNYACIRSKVNELNLGLKYSSGAAWYNGASVTINNTGTVQIKSYDGTEPWTVNFTPVGVYPTSNKALELGTSTNKWKTLNGVNPGALCFPEGTTGNANTTFNPDLTNWLTDGTGFTITAQVTGWLHIRIQNSTGNFAWVKRASAGSNQTWGIVGNSDTNSDIADIPLNVPVVQGYVYTLKLKTSRLSAAIFMCLGNV